MNLAVRIVGYGIAYITIGVLSHVISPALGVHNHLGSPAAFAADLIESKAVRAARLRNESRARSATGIGYETIGDPDDTKPYPMDYRALGTIISRLGTIIQQIEAAEFRSERKRPHIPGLPGVGQEATNLARTYGPEGPTVISVRALLSYRLVILGNANLQVGTVEDRNTHIVAKVVTREKSLVANYQVNKKTGKWRQINVVQ